MKLSFRLFGFFLIGLFLFASVVNADPSQTASKQIGDLINQERYDDAIALANRLARQTPNNPFIYSNRGQAYMYKGQWQKALDDFNRAIKLDPGVWTFHHFRGSLYDKKGRLDKAVKSYNKSISLNPQAVMSLSRRSYMYWLQGRYDQAVRDADRVLELNPSQFYALRYRSLSHWVEGRKDQAVRICSHRSSSVRRMSGPIFIWAITCIHSTKPIKPRDILTGLMSSIRLP